MNSNRHVLMSLIISENRPEATPLNQQTHRRSLSRDHNVNIVLSEDNLGMNTSAILILGFEIKIKGGKGARAQAPHADLHVQNPPLPSG